MYALGIDLGTTYTAAATWRDNRVEIASLGSRGAAIPSVVLLRQDETILTGETATRRALTEPERVAREFKRRLGDPTPILLGGVPYSAEALTAKLLQWVVDEVSTREGGAPHTICVCHPANWGPYKLDLLRQAVRMSNLEQPVTFTTEPEAAAIFYAQGRPVPRGAVVAVYDLGGGTFDAAVLRKTDDGFAILGQPEGIERLGGIDFDAAVFNHVNQAIGDKLAGLDEGDSAAVAAVARLREECVQAKEALSSDTDVAIPVLLPNLSTEVRLTRAELEGMVRPVLYESIEALRRALRSAAVAPEELNAVLLVGGSSRMPLVTQLVGAELGRPVTVDAHPKHAIALGAAWVASNDAFGARETPTSAPLVAPPPAQAATVPSGPMVAAPSVSVPAATPPPRSAVAPDATPWTSPATSRRRAASGTGSVFAKGVLFVASALGAAALVVAGYSYFDGGDPETQQAANTGLIAESPSAAEPAPAAEPPQIPADEQCTDSITSNERWVCITSARVEGDNLVIEYQAEWAGEEPNKSRGFHVHFYGTDLSGGAPPADIMGEHAAHPGEWYMEDQQPSVHRLDSKEVQALRNMPKVCARISNSNHGLVPDSDGGFGTGNCAPIQPG